MMPYFIYNDINSIDEEMAITSMPRLISPEKRIETIEIDGRDGDIEIDNGYAAFDIDIKVTMKKRKVDIWKLKKWLSGSGKLILSTDPSKYYEASSPHIELAFSDKLLKGSIKFHLQPYKYMVREPVYTGLASVEANNQGYTESLPAIKITGTGITEVKVNNVACCQINIDDGYVILDSAEQDAYKGSVLKNRLMTGEFPVLKPGNNLIECSGNVTGIEVSPRSRWL